MEKETWIIVGLGNPGAQYAHTRHNAGFDALAVLADKLNVSITRKKDDALVGECYIGSEKTLLCMPQTYMNLSGYAVSGLMNYFRIPQENLLVIYDDIDLPPGTVRIRKNGSAGTHNGMRSIVEQLGTQDFPRIRVGTGDRPEGRDLADWVLSKFSAQEEKALGVSLKNAAEAALCIIDKGVPEAANKFNGSHP